MELIMHIGAHKTGTSSIQAFLNSHRESLEQKNWEFVTVNGSTNLGNCISFGMDGDRAKFSFHPHMYQKLLSALSVNDKNKIISAEDLFFINDEAALKQLSKDISPIFSQVTILVYLRNQVDMAISNKAQGAKTNQSALVFGNDHRTVLPPVDKNVFEYLNYAEKLELWKKYFPSARLVVKEYERKKLINGDSVADFLHVTQLPVAPTHVSVNESVGSKLTNTLHALRTQGLAPHHAWGLFRKEKFIDIGGVKQMPDKQSAQVFFESFSAVNRAVEQKYSIKFDVNFDKYSGEQQALLGEDVVSILAPVLNELCNVNDDENINLIRDCALIVEKTDVEKAYRLMKLAGEMRPNGSFIKKKISEYEAILGQR
ncbi:hypothetical protein [Vibrio sp. WXL103]|uniref:hypothetical protein n=1 Tax=Vibrio sp. WXL103 TaxID=3450710 RepID=UPI003EC7F28A